MFRKSHNTDFAIACVLFVAGCSELQPREAIQSTSAQPTHVAAFNSLAKVHHAALAYVTSAFAPTSERIERGFLWSGATPYRIERDSSATGWMCRGPGQENESPDFIAYWYVTGAYDNRRMLRVWATTWRAKIYVRWGLSAVVYPDDTVAACIGHQSVKMAEKSDRPDSLALLMNVI